jgi:hypothetical protein
MTTFTLSDAPFIPVSYISLILPVDLSILWDLNNGLVTLLLLGWKLFVLTDIWLILRYGIAGDSS